MTKSRETADLNNGLDVDASGNVGIGTTSPSTFGGTLNVVGAALGGETTLVLSNSNTSQFVRLGINNNEAQIAYDNADELVFGQAASSNDAGIATEHMRINSSGNVGIGEAVPAYPLEIKGVSDTYMQLVTPNTTGAAGLFFGDSAANGVGRITYTHSNDSMLFYTGSTNRMAINSSGGVIAGSTDPSFGGAVAGDVVTTGGLNFNGMHVTKSKYMNLTTTTTDILECANRATYKITMSACDTSAGGFRGSQTAWLSVSNDYAGQGAIVTNVSGNLVLAWKAASGYGVSSRTLTARTTSATANAWVITVEIMSNYARSYEGTGVGSSYFLI